MKRALILGALLSAAACDKKTAAPAPPEPKPRAAPDAGGSPARHDFNRPAPTGGEVRRLPNDMLQLVGHTEPILAVAIDPSGKRAATGGMDRSVRLWDLEAGKVLWSVGPADEAVTVLEFDPKGEVLAAGDRAYQVRLLAVKDGAVLRRRAHPDAVNSLAFSPDGKWLAVAGSGGSGEIYPADSDEPSKCELRGRTVGFTDEGKHVVTALQVGALVVTQVADCKRVKETSTAPHLPFAVTSPRSSLVATRNGAEPFVLLWDALGGRMLGKLEKAGEGGITSVALSADAKRALVTSEDRHARLYDVEKRELIETLETGSIPFAALSPDGKKALITEGATARLVPLK